jgi:hypothetical protein
MSDASIVPDYSNSGGSSGSSGNAVKSLLNNGSKALPDVNGAISVISTTGTININTLSASNAIDLNIAGSSAGVLSVIAGTNITVTGTPTNPVVSANAVRSIQGLSDVVTLTGTNCNITTNANNINIDATPALGVLSVDVTGNGLYKTGTATNPILQNSGVTSLREMIGDIRLEATGNITIVDDFPNKLITIGSTGSSGVNSVSVTGAGLLNSGTSQDIVLQNTGINQINTGAGLSSSTASGVSTISNTGVTSISTIANNGTGLAVTNGGVGDITMKLLLESGVGIKIRPSTVDAVLYVDNLGVTSFSGAEGNVNIVAGTNISIVKVNNDFTINQINVPVSNRASGSTPLLITATTLATAQTIGNLSLTTSAVYDIDIISVVVLQTNSNSKTDMNLFVTVDGVQVGQVFTSTLDGSGHYLSMPQQCSAINATAGAHTILLKGFASTGSVFTANSFQLRGLGNLA